MHPTPLDVAYFRRVAEAAEGAAIGAFEICGDCHGTQSGLDGLYGYDEYASVLSEEERAVIGENRRRLNQISEICQQAGKDLLFWHREAVVPPMLAQLLPGLLDENGEFNFFGGTYAQLIERKINGALAACPGISGLVLTLTEAQYAVIHPSNPERYPGEKVVEHVSLLFAETLAKHGKSFVLRSFGSTPEDYATLLAGAERAARKIPFEIETKVTPYDFIPFFRENPFLRPTPGCTLSVEFDGLGEFLGAGYFPAAGIEDLLHRIEQAREAGAERFAMRFDRTGHCLLDQSYAAKLPVFEAAVHDGPEAGRAAYTKWLEAQVPGRAEDLRALLATGWEATLKTLYAGGNVICHTNPVAPLLKWIKAGGFFGVLHGSGDLSKLSLIWSILADRPALSREQLLAEKAAAVDQVAGGRQQLEALREALPPALLAKLDREWRNLETLAPAMQTFVSFCAEALCGLEVGEDRSARLAARLKHYRDRFAPGESHAPAATSGTIEHDLFASATAPVEEAWLRPLASIMQQLLDEYSMERELRRKLAAEPGVFDFMVPGGIADDWRIGRPMHASHAFVIDGVLARAVGNALFPDGFVDLYLNRPLKEAEIRIRTLGPGSPMVEFGGQSRSVQKLEDGLFGVSLPPRSPSDAETPVRIRRGTADDLALVDIAVFA